MSFENNKAPNIESIIIPAPLEYVSAAKEYFESYDYVEEKHENHVNDQFKSKVILDQKYSYCEALYRVAMNSYNQNSIYGASAKKSNEVVTKMYQSAENHKNLIKCQKLLIWQQKDMTSLT